MKASSMSPSSICRARRAMAVGQSALGYMVPYPMVSWVSRANEKAAVNPVTYLTHRVCPGGGLSWSTPKSPLARAKTYHSTAKRSQWRRKEPQNASTTQRQRRESHAPHMSLNAPIHVSRTPEAGLRIRLRPSLVTNLCCWGLVFISGDDELLVAMPTARVGGDEDDDLDLKKFKKRRSKILSEPHGAKVWVRIIFQMYSSKSCTGQSR